MGKFTTISLVFSTLCKWAIFSLSYSSTDTTTKMKISPSCPFKTFAASALLTLKEDEECKNQENCAAELEITLNRLC